jgi:hypothetical protein
MAAWRRALPESGPVRGIAAKIATAGRRLRLASLT